RLPERGARAVHPVRVRWRAARWRDLLSWLWRTVPGRRRRARTAAAGLGLPAGPPSILRALERRAARSELACRPGRVERAGDRPRATGDRSAGTLRLVRRQRSAVVFQLCCLAVLA